MKWLLKGDSATGREQIETDLNNRTMFSDMVQRGVVMMGTTSDDVDDFLDFLDNNARF